MPDNMPNHRPLLVCPRGPLTAIRTSTTHLPCTAAVAPLASAEALSGHPFRSSMQVGLIETALEVCSIVPYLCQEVMDE
jgi:hypothetical protein